MSTRLAWVRNGLLPLLLIPSLGHPAASTGAIAFVAARAGNWDLYIMRETGSSAIRLTTSPLDERAPALSPDGKQVAYSTSDGALWLMELTTHAAVKVATPDVRCSNPSWAPDGQQLAFTVYTLTKDGEDADVWAYSLNEKRSKLILKQDGAQDYVTYSPDGLQMMYSSSGATIVSGFGFQITQQLWIASLQTGRVRELLLARAKDTEPEWSPDGRFIAFSSDRSGDPDIWVVDPEGNGLRQLTRGPAADLSPTWSPDGVAITYVSSEGGRMRLKAVDVKTGGVRAFAPFADQMVDVKDPHWR